MSDAIDVTPAQMKTLRALLQRHLPGVAAWAYGSRVKWTSRPASDLDLVVFASPEQKADVSELREAFDESNLPFRVDLFVWDEIPENFRKNIEGERFVVQEGATETGEWQAVPFKEVLINGTRTGVYKKKEFHGSGVKIVNMGELFAHPRLRDVPMKRVELSEREIDKSMLLPGDLLFARRSLVAEGAGKCSIVMEIAEPTTFESSIIRTRPDNKKADSLFLYYAFNSPVGRHLLGTIRRQVAVSGITGTDLVELNIPRPPLSAQRAIAAILGSLDDKIEQNRRTARALERLARAIFRAWFVDFEPVKAKAADATSFPSMPQEVFDALPTRFVDSEIGPVPEGWEVKPLTECIQLTMGQSPSSKYYNETGNGLPFHQGVSNYGFRFPTHRIYCTVEGRIAEPGDVLLSVRAPVGRINVADRRLVLGRGLAGLRHPNGRQSFLLHQFSHVFAEEDAVGDGTIYKAVTKRFLSQMPLLAPSEDTESAFDDIVRPLDKLVAVSEIESSKLATMRDYLLPKLMSGAVHVPDVSV